ncbi:MAG: ATP-dependent DNA helicase RecG, partial [Methylobacter sp.]|nr:ATP-dependent DNA helicase RecG [Methylobacter sp.]
MSAPNNLSKPVATLTGIGAQTAHRLEKLGIRVVQDLLFHLPHRYEDRTHITPIGSLTAGMSALIKGTIEFTDMLPKGRSSLICRISDGTGFISLKFFHYTASQHNLFKPGTAISCFAEARFGFAGLEMVHPEYKILSDPDQSITDSRLTPVYPL